MKPQLSGMRFDQQLGSSGLPQGQRVVRTLFLSDLHLGSRACRSDRLIEFLRHHRADALYLVGDIIDAWRLRSSWYWPPAHETVLQELLRTAQRGVRVIYTPGNHDEFLRDYFGTHFAGIEVVDSTIHVAADGCRYVVTHGDRFDRLMERTRRLAPIKNLGLWTRGVDTELFKPDRAVDLGLPRPIFVSVGRVAIEKNLEAFLSLDLPGSKVVIGQGPQANELRRRFPDARFPGLVDDKVLAAHLAAADVFVFPSRTDTFGIVQLEALASGLPVAAYPVVGPRDVIGGYPIGVLHEDLRTACLGALEISREACRAFALTRSWEVSARQFLAHVERVRIDAFRNPRAA